MLYLNPYTGCIEIDQQMVDKYITDLKHQLDGQTNNIFAWTQVWNSYAATFFTSNFGKPADCFGRRHIDNMLATHQRIQRQTFSSPGPPDTNSSTHSSSVISHLRDTISLRFNIHNIPDGYFYLPTSLGGLELRNPFINLLQIRNTVHPHPQSLLDIFENSEAEAYRVAKARFDSGQIEQYRYGNIHPDSRPLDGDTFFPFKEFVKYRDIYSEFPNSLGHIYGQLLAKPAEESVEIEEGRDLKAALDALGDQVGPGGILANWDTMQPYWKWVVQLYGPEMVERFGGLRIVEKGLLPMGMLGLLRSGRVEWRE